MQKSDEEVEAKRQLLLDALRQGELDLAEGRYLTATSDDDLRAIFEGLSDLKAGRTVPHEEVVRWLRSWGTPDEIDPPKCPD